MLNNDNSPRTTALWEAAMNELIEKKLVKAYSDKGRAFDITQKGFDVADYSISQS